MHLSETVLILMLLLAVGTITAGLFRKLPIPYSVLLVVIGILLAELAAAWEPLAPLEHFQLTPDLVLFIFLPTLIFESGFNLNARQLIKDIAPVMSLAVPALLFSTFAVGLGIWLVLHIEPGMALVFGALISATDPVAVVALFKELGTPERLTVLVEGESLLNDATAIVVFNILLGITLYGSITWSDAGLAAGEFLRVFFGGVVVGTLLGFLMSWLMNRLRPGSAATLILSLVLAYTSFIIAEHALHLSGVMAVVGAAVTLGVFGLPRLPRKATAALGETWEFLALICNTLLFLLVGLSVDLGSLLGGWDAILIAVALVLAARASMIYTLVPAATRLFRLPRVTLGERHIMWWGGLKGGLAIAIVLSIPQDIPGRQILLDLTLGVVLFTLLVNAPTIRPLIRLLGLDVLTPDERLEMKHGLALARDSADHTLGQFLHAGLISRASHHQTREHLRQLMATDQPPVSEEHRNRRTRLKALRAELETLERLYQAHVIPHYTFLDLRRELVRAREHVIDPERRPTVSLRHQNPFLRLEDALIRRLREHDWAAALFSSYQNLRMSQHLIKDIARILMTEAALDHLKLEPELSGARLERIRAHYRKRLGGFRANIADTRRDFPDFYRRFETRLGMRAGLMAALGTVEAEAHQGALGAKAHTIMEMRIQAEIERLPPLSEPVPELDRRELISMVPLFAGLSQGALTGIAQKAQTVRFLAEDTIIGEGEHGDALYTIAQGRVEVSRREADESETHLGDLGPGDFFGETALLGRHLRNANVRAAHSCTLLRLTRRDVMLLAEEHPEVNERLEEARRKRTPASD